MHTRAELEAQRETVLSQMRLIRSMKHGTLSIRPEKIFRKGEKEPGVCGPYPLFVRREGKRTVGRRLHSAQEVAQVRADIAAYDRFRALCKEFVAATERLGDVERTAAPVADREKKTPKSRSRRARK